MKATGGKASVWIVILLVSMLTVYAKDKDKEKGRGNKAHERAGTRVDIDIFADSQRELIRHHYIGDRGSLPPGLAKREGRLPPGLEKQLVRNGHLPPGLEKKLSPFPVELERRLPPLRAGLVRGVIGGSAVIVNNKTKVILDIFAIR